MAAYDFEPVHLRTGCKDSDGRLVFIDGELVAVIVLLADEMHGDQRGLWSMEADFQTVQSNPPLFGSPYDAAAWLRRQNKEHSSP